MPSEWSNVSDGDICSPVGEFVKTLFAQLDVSPVNTPSTTGPIVFCT